MISNQAETNGLFLIENVIGSDDGDVIVSSDLTNALNGANGDDLHNGEGGDDILVGGSGADTFQFGVNFGYDVVEDYETGLDQLQFDYFGPEQSRRHRPAENRSGHTESFVGFCAGRCARGPGFPL